MARPRRPCKACEEQARLEAADQQKRAAAKKPRPVEVYKQGLHKGLAKPREPRPEVVACRVTKAEMARCKQAAEQAGLSVAEWVRVKIGLGR